MADLKISQLGSIVTVVPATDVLPVVQGGTTLKITPNQILGAGGTATLASATITGAATVGTTLGVTGVSTLASAVVTGALTVDTTTLVVDATNDRVGIGTASPGKRCEINQSANAITTIGAGEILRLIGDDGNTASRITEVGFGPGPSGATYSPAIIGAVNISAAGFGTKDFYVATRSGITDVAPLERLRVTAAGNVNITTGNVVMATSGKGIDFSAVTGGTGTATANVLNDYEEGTFTPTVLGSTTAGVGVYTSQIGRYTKVGNLVTINVYMDWTAHTGTGNLIFGGLPFNTNSDATTFTAFTIGYATFVTLSANNVLTAFAEAGTSNIGLFQYPVGGGASTAVPIDTAAVVIYTGTYRV